MSEHGKARDPSDVPSAAGRLRHGDIAYVSLWVPDVERAAGFFSSVLGWRYGPRGGPESRQVVGTSLPHGLWGGQPRSTLMACYAVEDIEAAVDRVRSAGGTAEEAHEEPNGLIADCVDSEDVRFAVFEPPDGVAGGSRHSEAGRAEHGGLAYVTMEVVDSAEARSFYGTVLGWRFAQGSVPDGWQVEDVVPMVGMAGGCGTATTVPMYQVDDIVTAAERVRSAGGTATEPEVQPYGITSQCVDPEETRFYLGQL
jgi:predicted enzyme related to lactoylglutathione lyase